MSAGLVGRDREAADAAADSLAIHGTPRWLAQPMADAVVEALVDIGWALVPPGDDLPSGRS